MSTTHYLSKHPSSGSVAEALPRSLRRDLRSALSLSMLVSSTTCLIGFGTLASLPGQAQGFGNMTDCLHARDPDQRAKLCTKVIDNTHDRRVLLRALTARGNALCASDDRCAEAVSDFAAVVKMAPGVAGYQDNYARALRAAERFEEAGAASDRAISLAPQLAFPRVGKAKALEGAGHLADALRTLDQAMGLAPANAGLWEYKGKLYGELKDPQKAYDAFDRALALDPDRMSVYVSRAAVESIDGRRESAIADLHRYPADGKRADEVHAALKALQAQPDNASQTGNAGSAVQTKKVEEPRSNSSTSIQVGTTQPAEASSDAERKRLANEAFKKNAADLSARAEAIKTKFDEQSAAEKPGSGSALDCGSSTNAIIILKYFQGTDFLFNANQYASDSFYVNFSISAVTTLEKQEGFRRCQIVVCLKTKS